MPYLTLSEPKADCCPVGLADALMILKEDRLAVGACKAMQEVPRPAFALPWTRANSVCFSQLS